MFDSALNSTSITATNGSDGSSGVAPNPAQQLLSINNAAWLVGLEPADIRWLHERALFPRALQMRGRRDEPLLLFYRKELEQWLAQRLCERDADVFVAASDGMPMPMLIPVPQPINLALEMIERGVITTGDNPSLMTPYHAAAVAGLEPRDITHQSVI
jgi:hypothetical protein